MEWLGFERNDIRTVTLIAALVSIIGPLIVAFILDRVSVKRPASYGKWLRALLFVCFIATGVFFALLLLISPEHREVVDKDPTTTFSCDEHGGHVFVKRVENRSCNNLEGHGGHLKLYNCTYTCERPENFKYFYNQTVDHTKVNPYLEKLRVDPNAALEPSNEDDDYDENKSSYDDFSQPEALRQAPTEPPIISPPHICVNNGTVVNCNVYLSEVIINLMSVEGAGHQEGDINKFSDNFCKHPLSKQINNFVGCH